MKKRRWKSMRLANTIVITKTCWFFINVWNIKKSKHNFHSSNTKVAKPRLLINVKFIEFSYAFSNVYLAF